MISNPRSLLFVPATAVNAFEKAADRGADALIIDLEDAIPYERKVDARQLARNAITTLSARSPIYLRVNSEEALLEQDIAAVCTQELSGVMLPKVEHAEQVVQLACLIRNKLGSEGRTVPIVALIETPLGVIHSEQIATSHASICALGFGAEDYAAAMETEPEATSVMWAAQAVTNAARAYGLACWGLPGSVAEIKDLERFEKLVRLAKQIGFSGTVCIHPRQIEVANAGFEPSSDQRLWATKTVAAFEAAAAQGKGVTTVDGRMVDKPIYERARRWLASGKARK